MTHPVLEQIAVMRRQGGGQYNLNSDEIGAIRIPVPSIPIQQDIVKRFNDAKDDAKVYYDKTGVPWQMKSTFIIKFLLHNLINTA